MDLIVALDTMRVELLYDARAVAECNIADFIVQGVGGFCTRDNEAIVARGFEVARG